MTDKLCNMSVPWYLMSAYMYYEHDVSYIPDALFDRLAKLMLENWSRINHYHKFLITEDMLVAGTYLGIYPEIVKDSAWSLHRGRKTREKWVAMVEKICSALEAASLHSDGTLEDFFG